MSARVVLSFNDEIVREVELVKPVTVVGRHPDCDIVIEHPAVSGRHMLFRIVNQTVYAEDLASTNGTRVNGLPTMHQVVHHLDTIEIGRHKMHFFDDTLLAGGVSSLENTVLTEFERTMMAENLSERPAPAPVNGHRRDEDLSRTLAIPRDPALREAAMQGEVVLEDEVLPEGSFALRVIAGERRGEIINLNRANTMIGLAGGDTALVVKRGEHYFLARFSGHRPPRLNRQDLGPGTHPISPHDVIDVGGSSFEVIQAT